MLSRSSQRRNKAGSYRRAGGLAVACGAAVLGVWHSSSTPAQVSGSPLPAATPASKASPRAGVSRLVARLPSVLTEAGLASRAAAATSWCEEQGTATLAEIAENFDSFAEDIGLEYSERRRLEEALSSHATYPSDAAVLDTLPADALVESPAMKKLADLLVRVQMSGAVCKDGKCELDGRLDAFLEEATSQIREGRGADWTRLVDILLGSSADEASRKEAMAVLEPAATLFTLGNDQSDELRVTGATADNGMLSFAATIDGKEHRLRLQKTEGPSSWGLWSSYYVSDGPAALLGKRFVASTPNVFGRNILRRLKAQDAQLSGDSPKAAASKAAAGGFSLEPGDLVYFASPDRAAVLELATYDRMPEMAQQLADILKEREKTGFRGQPEVLAPDDLKKAARFRNREELLGEKERLAAKLQRLTEFPLVQDTLRQAKDVPEFMALEGVAEDWALDVYNATRTSMLRTKKPSAIAPRKVEVNTLSLPKVMGVISLLVGAAVAVSQMHFFDAPQQFSEDLPMFTLKSGEI